MGEALDPRGTMPLLEHLRELRARLRDAVIALIGGFVIAYVFSQEIFLLLAQPVLQAWERQRLVDPSLGAPKLNFGSLTEPFWTFLSVSLWAGIFVAAPFIFYQLWRFVAPGLYRSERRKGLVFAGASAVFFTGGAAFCYFLVLPTAFDFFLSYATDNLARVDSALGGSYTIGPEVALSPTLFMNDYLDLTRKLMLAFGLVFELPVAVILLASAGVVTHRGLWKFNRWAIVLAFIVAAVLTPGPDIISQVMMALPMIVLYNLSVLGALVITRRRERG